MADTATAATRPANHRNPLTGWVADRKVGTKIFAALAIGILASIAVGVAGIQATATANGHTRALAGENIRAMYLLTEVRTTRLRGQLALDQVLVRGGQTAKQSAVQAVEKEDGLHDAALTSYKALPATNEEHAILATYDQEFGAFRQVRQSTLLPLALAGKNAEFLAAYAKDGAPRIAAAQAAIIKLADLESAGAEARVKAAAASGDRGRTMIIGFIVAGVVLAAGIGLWIARMITRSVQGVGSALTAMANGDLTATVDVRSRDEVGRMAGALNSAMDTMRITIQTIEQSASSLAAASEELTGVSTQIAATAEEAAAQAGVVASAADEVSRNVQTVAAGSEEMGASIREIAQNANEAAKVASQAVTVAGTANDTVTKLGDSSTEIGNVVKVITSIAEQTNLLALNATIEAARAGEAGKGFAVVANEVKDLAQETARATEDISRRVDAIQADTGGAVEAIGEIGRIIGRINDYQLTISSAVEEQTATTNEMNRSVTEAATGSSEIAANISGVAAAAQLTTESVADSQRASEDLARMSSELQTVIGRFQV
jgi:methyl-accepting chemotaxis protein